jgi:protein-S-isoprenylcysteine O-methyltransferase
VETYAPALYRPAAAGVFWALWLAVVGSTVWPPRRDGAAAAQVQAWSRWRNGSSLLAMVASIAAGSGLGAVATARLRAAGLGDGWLWYGVGLGLAAAGLAVRAWSMRATDPAGPYRIVRYPGYAGTLLALAGFGLGQDNIVAVLATVLVPLPAIAYRIALEERTAPGARGKAALAYVRARARLIPGVW